MSRKPNRHGQRWRPCPPDPDRIYHWEWLPHEKRRLEPFPKGGGLQSLVNRLWQNTNSQTLSCWCDAYDYERVIHYIKTTGPGGPNDLLREICIPVWRRTFGVELVC